MIIEIPDDLIHALKQVFGKKDQISKLGKPFIEKTVIEVLNKAIRRELFDRATAGKLK